MKGADKKVFHCPLELSFSLVGGKWRCVILWHLRKGELRFSALQRRLPGITPKMLTQELRELEAYGLLNRKVYAVVPPKVEYSLTESGERLIPVLRQIYQWGREYATEHDVPIDMSLQAAIIAEERQKKRASGKARSAVAGNGEAEEVSYV